MRYYFLIVAISFLPTLGILLPQDLLHTHDGLVHLPRIAAYFKALTDGQIPVRWAGDLNFGYGLPLFNFIYQLPYFVASLFLFLGIGLVSSFKLTLVISFLLSGVFMFAFAKVFFADEKKALIVAVFYQFAPFRLVELLIRGSFGEVYAYTFLPLTLLGITLFLKNQSFSYFTLVSVSTALLVLSHNSVSLLFFAVIILFVLFFAKGTRIMALGILALLLGLLLSAFYWVPAIFEHKFTYGDLFMRNLYLEHFSPIQNFFIPNFFNSKMLQIGGVSVQIGIFHVMAIILGSFLLFRKKEPLLVYSLFLITFAFFFTQPISKIFWEYISFLRQFQFPWRFLSVLVFATSLLSYYFFTLSIFKKTIIYWVFIGIVVFSTSYYWQPKLGVDKIDENYYWNFPLNTTYYGETDIIWSAGPQSSYPKERVTIIAGQGTIEHFTKKSNLQTFTVSARTPITIASRTQYFPGWRAYVDGKEIPIQFQDPNWRGLITFSVPKGSYMVTLAFTETKLRLFADLVSFATLITILAFSFRKAAFL